MKDYSEVVPMTFKISVAQKERLEQLSQQLGRSRSELVREAIMALLGVYYGTRTKEDALAETMDAGVARGKH